MFCDLLRAVRAAGPVRFGFQSRRDVPTSVDTLTVTPYKALSYIKLYLSKNLYLSWIKNVFDAQGALRYPLPPAVPLAAEAGRRLGAPAGSGGGGRAGAAPADGAGKITLVLSAAFLRRFGFGAAAGAAPDEDASPFACSLLVVAAVVAAALAGTALPSAACLRRFCLLLTLRSAPPSAARARCGAYGRCRIFSRRR